jgi:hypothetical protein
MEQQSPPEFPCRAEVEVEISSNVDLDSNFALHLILTSEGLLHGVLTSSLLSRPSSIVSFLDTGNLTREERVRVVSVMQRVLVTTMQQTFNSMFGPGRSARQPADRETPAGGRNNQSRN